MPLEHKQPRTVAPKGMKKVRQSTSGNKTQITVLACASASRQVVPPMVVFSGKNFNHALSEGEVPDTFYGMSDSGWMDQELFASWFTHHFLKHAVSSRPLMLILDGHSSHFTLNLVQSAAEQDVVIFCLPPHTTADSQPLDTSCFGPLKTHWFQACRDYLYTNPGRVVTKFQFSRLFSQAWSNGMTISNITAGFRHTGIYPFNPNVILDKIEEVCVDNTESNVHVEDESVQSNIIPEQQNHSRFSQETIRLYKERYINGFDIYTEDYVAWLQEVHPESVPQLSTIFHAVPPLDSCAVTPDDTGE